MTARSGHPTELGDVAGRTAPTTPDPLPTSAWWDGLAPSGPACTFALSSVRVTVRSNNQRVIDELAGYLGGHFPVTAGSSGPQPDWTVGILDTPDPLAEGIGAEPVVLHDFGADKVVGTRSVRHPGTFTAAGGDCLIVADVARRRITIAGQYRAGSLYPHREAALTGIAHEIIRHLIRLQLEFQGGLVVHASAVGCRDQALLVVGDKRAGKSTLLTALLLHGGADYLAGDRVFLWPEPDPSGWLVAGWPTALRLNPATAGIFAGLRAVADAARHAGPPEREAGSRKLHIHPADIPGLLAVPVRPVATLTTVLFLGTAVGQPSTEVSEVSAERGLGLIEPNLLTPHDPQHPNWLDLPRPSSRALQAARQAFTGELGSSVRLLELPVCGWTEQALAVQVGALREKLGWPPAAPGAEDRQPAAAGPRGAVTVLTSARGPLVLPGRYPAPDGQQGTIEPDDPTDRGRSAPAENRHPTTGQDDD
ncbi:hypothetical protein [Jatrophihabitans sp.]|uniref:hypothetical protein n=1 Tax=Jatrophihabitans sp. TaxID=1932789 RepID=UPI002B5A5A97|nr:hypothetical protein [Jatrophihabitans sp.]